VLAGEHGSNTLFLMGIERVDARRLEDAGDVGSQMVSVDIIRRAGRDDLVMDDGVANMVALEKVEENAHRSGIRGGEKLVRREFSDH
jgi:hypothetical protein